MRVAGVNCIEMSKKKCVKNAKKGVLVAFNNIEKLKKRGKTEISALPWGILKQISYFCSRIAMI